MDFRSGDALDVHAQRLDDVGVADPAWEPNANRLCVGTASEVASVRVGDGVGGAFIAWVDTRVEEGDIYAQHLSAGGGVAPGWPAYGLALCTAPGAQYGLTISSDGAGGAVVAWMDFRKGGHSEVRAQRVGSAGAVLWTSDGVQVAADSSDQVSPTLGPDGAGGAYVVWAAVRSQRTDLSLAHLDGTGHADPSLPASGLSLVSGSGRRGSPRLVPRPAGSWLMWEEGADTSATVRVLPLGPIGDPEPSWPANGRTLSGAGGGVSLSDAVADTSGGIIAVWCEGTTGTHQLRAQRLAPDGTFPWGSAALSLCDHAAEQYAPAIGADGHGGLLAAWEDYRAGGEADIWAQHVTASGQRAWSDGGSAACVLSGHQFAPAIASDGLGGAIVTWVDGPASARASYMRLRQAGGGAVPRLLSAVAAPGRAEVTWRTEPGDARRLTVQRKDAGGDWQAVAVARPDESGVLAHSDHGLATGTTVAYRLASLEPRAETYYAEVSLVIPSPRPLALRSARALAGGRTLRLLLTLETDEPAAFEVFDVQGRRVNAGPLETQGAGDYSLEISLAHKLGGGLYFVRLHQGRAARTQRMMVIP